MVAQGCDNKRDHNGATGRVTVKSCKTSAWQTRFVLAGPRTATNRRDYWGPSSIYDDVSVRGKEGQQERGRNNTPQSVVPLALCRSLNWWASHDVLKQRSCPIQRPPNPSSVNGRGRAFRPTGDRYNEEAESLPAPRPSSARSHVNLNPPVAFNGVVPGLGSGMRASALA